MEITMDEFDGPLPPPPAWVVMGILVALFLMVTYSVLRSL